MQIDLQDDWIYLRSSLLFSQAIQSFPHLTMSLSKAPSTSETKTGDVSESNNVPITVNSTGLQKELASVDQVLVRKMALVNGAIDEIGMTGFQWKLFFLNGFGYAVDSVLGIRNTRGTDMLTTSSFSSFASPSPSPPSPRNSAIQASISLECLLHPKLAS